MNKGSFIRVFLSVNENLVGTEKPRFTG